MSGFLDLPEEIKTLIYEYCLVVSETIQVEAAPYDLAAGVEPFSWPNKEFGFSIFAVNKAIRERALNVFYGSNTFELNFASRRPRQRTFWIEHNHRIRHVAIKLDSRDLEPSLSIEVFQHYLRDPSFAAATQQKIAATIHERRIHRLLSESWRRKARLIRLFTLKSLEIDVKNLRCPEGCCWLVRRVFEEADVPFGTNGPTGFFVEWHRHDETVACIWDHKNHRRGEPPELTKMRIKVLGMKDGEEAERMHALGFACEHCPMVGKTLDNKACKRKDPRVREGG